MANTITISCPSNGDHVNLTFDGTGSLAKGFTFTTGTEVIVVMLYYPPVGSNPPEVISVSIPAATAWRATLTASHTSSQAYVGAKLLDAPGGTALAFAAGIPVVVVNDGTGRVC